MNLCVPDFHEIMEDDDYSIHPAAAPPPSGLLIDSRQKKPATSGEEEIMELLWKNGQLVVHSQNQRPSKKTTFAGGITTAAEVAQRESIRSTAAQEQQHLFMHEDEMASWLQYPIDDSSFDRDLYADLLYSAPPPPPIPAVAEIRPPPIPPPVANPPRLQNFVHFSRVPIKQRTDPTSNKPSAREESNETPAVRPESRVSHLVADSRRHLESGTAKVGGTSGELAAEFTVTSSPGGSGASFSASGEPQLPPHRPPPPSEDRKRKGRETDENECQSEDIEFEAVEIKKQGRGSASTKRSRAAEVHNLSERRRRDRINEKMRALQELIPRCNKSDKASMLDEAIEYLKSLQMQVQMMSMGCGMVPMMYPGMQQYMPAMGMGMDMGMNRPMVPFPTVLPASAMPNPAAAHMGPRFPMPPGFHMPPVPVQGSNQQPDPASSHSLNAPHNQNQPRMPNFVDPYQQFLGLHQPRQLPLQHNQQLPMMQGGTNRASTSKADNNQAG